ncbi:unnamed protein product, partial [Urochloa humidicola]
DPTNWWPPVRLGRVLHDGAPLSISSPLQAGLTRRPDRSDMAQTPSSSAGAKEAGRGTGEPPLEAWTSEGYYSRNCLPRAAKFETIIEKMKGINVSSVDGVERAIDSIKLARQDVVFIKSTRTWIIFGAVITGFTLGATWVAPLPRKGWAKELQQ